jgi:hypothetical protein
MPSLEFPAEILVNPKDKLLVVTPELEASFPNAVQVFEEADQAFINDPEAHLKSLEGSLFTFESSTGAKIDCSLIPGNGSELLVMWAPFSDGSPNSNAETIYKYISDDKFSKVKAAPNSWNQTTKSGVVAELLRAVDREMPVLTIFSPLPSFPHNAYTHEDYEKIRQGNFGPAERITSEAIDHSQDRLHGKKSETQIDRLHLQGASLGASTAIGAADKLRVQTVTAQELIVAPRNVFPDLAARFTVKGTVGDASHIVVDENWHQIPEPVIRQKIDSRGNEPMMFARMLQGMSKVSRLKGLTRPGRNETPRLIESLVESGVSVLVPLAENSGLTHDTPKYLPGNGEHVVNVRAVAGERTSHLIDEQVALTGLMAVMNVRNNKA